MKFFKTIVPLLIFSVTMTTPVYCSEELSDYEFHYGEDKVDIRSAILPEAKLMDEEVSEYKDITQVFINTDSTTTPTREYLPATISIKADSKSGIDQGIETTPIKIKIRGNSTAGLDKKPYNIKFDNKVEILGFSKGKKFCFLANRYDKSFLRNYLAYTLSKECDLYYTPSFRFVDLWMNGTYVGNYLCTTPIETGKNRLDIDVDGRDVLLEREASRTETGVTYVTSPTFGVRLAFNEPEEPTEEQVKYVNEILDKVDKASSMSLNDMDDVIDVDSFIDFYIIEEFFKNRDVNFSSTRFYIKDDKFYAGPCWDFDLSSGNFPEESLAVFQNYYALNSPWISRMMKDPDFKAKFIARYKEIQYKIQKIIHYDLHSIDYKYKASFKRDKDVAGWDYRAQGLDRTPEPTHEGNVSFLKTWLVHRNNWLIDSFGIKDVIDYSEYYDNYFKAEVLFNKYDDVKHDTAVADLLNTAIDNTTTKSELDSLTEKLEEVVNRYPDENYSEGDKYVEPTPEPSPDPDNPDNPKPDPDKPDDPKPSPIPDKPSEPTPEKPIETDKNIQTVDVLENYSVECSSEINFNGSKLKTGSDVKLTLKDKTTGKLYSGSDIRLTGDIKGKVGKAKIRIKSVKGIKSSRKLFKNSKTFEIEIKPLKITRVVKNKDSYREDGDVILNTNGMKVKSIYVLVKNNDKVKKVRVKEFNMVDNVINLTGSIVGKIIMNITVE